MDRPASRDPVVLVLLLGGGAAAVLLGLVLAVSLALFLSPPKGPLRDPIVSARRALGMEDPAEVQQAAADFDAAAARAGELADAGDIERALPEFDRLIARAQSCSPPGWYEAYAWLYRGRALSHADRDRDAMHDLQRSRQLFMAETDPDSPFLAPPEAALALAAVSVGDMTAAAEWYDQARVHLEGAEGLVPESEVSHAAFCLGVTAQHLGLLQDQVEYLSWYRELQPEDAPADLQAWVDTELGWAEFSAGHLDEAEALLRSAAERSPEGEGPEALYGLVSVHLARSRFEEAEAVARTNADPLLGGLGLADVHLARGRLGEARKAADRALAAAGDEPFSQAMARQTLSEVAWHEGAFAEGEVQARKALELWPTEPPGLRGTALHVAAWSALGDGRAEDALESAREGLALLQGMRQPPPPQVAALHSTLAHILVHAGEAAEAEREGALALRTLQEAGLREGRWLAAAETSHADALLALGRRDEAKALHEQALTHLAERHSLGAAYALRGLGRIAAAEGHAAEARRLLGEALAARRAHLAPGHPEIREIQADLAGL